MFKRLLFFLSFLQVFEMANAQCPTILTDDPIEVCESGGTPLNIALGGAIFSAQWTPSIGLNDENILNPTLDFPVDTTYLLTVKGLDADSGDTCVVQKEIEINVVRYELKIALDTVELACGDSIRLNVEVIPNGSFFIMEWESSTGNIVRGAQTLRPLIDEIGTYKANVIGNLGRIVCRDKDSIEVILSNSESLVIAPPDKLGCGTNEVDLALENQPNPTDFIYQWQTMDGQIIADSDQPSIIVDQVGNYSVTRTNLLGECSTSTDVQVAEREPLTDFEIVVAETDCETLNGHIFIDKIKGGVGPFQFSIDDGLNFQSDAEFADLEGGNYSVIIKDSNGCQLERSTNFLQPKITELTLVDKAEIESGTEFQIPLTIESNGVDVRSIEWSPMIGLSCYNCEQPTIMDFKSRKYEVEVIDENDCVKKKAILVQVKAPNLFYQPSVFSPNGDGQNDFFKLYTNPKFVRNIQDFSISDRYGNLVFRNNGNDSNGWNGNYKGQMMPVGAYLYWAVLELNNGETTVINGVVNLVR